MGLDIEKTQEELNKKIAQNIDTPLLEEPQISEGGLNAVESQNLKTELSGEVITPGFTEQEAEALTDGLSGETLAPEDSIVLSNSDEAILPETEQINNLETGEVQDIENESEAAEVSTPQTEEPLVNKEDIEIIFNPNHPTFTPLKEHFSKLPLGDFRLGIGLLQTIEQLNIIRTLIDEMNFSKPEKLMLLNECLKQQGIIQNAQSNKNKLIDNENRPENITADSEPENDEKVSSRVAYELYTLCKTPAQRDLAKFIINNKKLYIFDENNNFILKKLFEKQTTDEELKTSKEFLEYITSEPIFQADKNSLNEQAIHCLNTMSPNNIKELTSLLKDYLSDKTIDIDLFLVLLKNCRNENDIKNVHKIIRFRENNEENKSNETKNNYIQDYLTLYSYISSSQNEENLPLFTELFGKVLVNNELAQNKEMLEFINQLVNEKKIKPQKIQVITNLTEEYNNEKPKQKAEPEKFCKICEKIHKSDNYAVVIKDFLANENENKKYTNPEHKAVVTLLEKDKEIYTDFATGRAYNDENLQNLFEHAQVDYKKDLLKTLCRTSSFSADNIITIMDNTPYYAINITKKIINSKNLTARQKTNLVGLINTNREITSAVEKILDKNNFDMATLPKILDSTRIHELEKKDKDGELDKKKNDDVESNGEIGRY